MSCCCYFVLTLFSTDGLVIPRKFLVRSETYVFSENLVQKDYKKICSHFFYCAFAMETVRVLWCHNSHSHENFDGVGKWCFITELSFER